MRRKAGTRAAGRAAEVTAPQAGQGTAHSQTRVKWAAPGDWRRACRPQEGWGHTGESPGPVHGRSQKGEGITCLKLDPVLKYTVTHSVCCPSC